MIGGGPIQTLNVCEDLHFDNERDIHMSFTNYKATDWGHNIKTLINLHWLSVYNYENRVQWEKYPNITTSTLVSSNTLYTNMDEIALCLVTYVFHANHKVGVFYIIIKMYSSIDSMTRLWRLEVSECIKIWLGQVKPYTCTCHGWMLQSVHGWESWVEPSQHVGVPFCLSFHFFATIPLSSDSSKVWLL